MILTIGPGGCGFSFLNWSIAYLRGDNYYYTLFASKIQVDIDPIKGFTAHNFERDHLPPETDRSILLTASTSSIIYVVPKDNADFKSLITFPGKKIIFDNSKFCAEQLTRDYTVVADSPFVYITNQLGKKYNIKQVKKILLDLSSVFYFDYYNLTSTTGHFVIDYYNMFNELDIKIIEIFKFLNLEIDLTRWNTWKDTYLNYKLLNKDMLSEFLKDVADGDLSNNTKILKEIVNWKNGSYQTT